MDHSIILFQSVTHHSHYLMDKTKTPKSQYKRITIHIINVIFLLKDL